MRPHRLAGAGGAHGVGCCGLGRGSLVHGDVCAALGEAEDAVGGDAKEEGSNRSEGEGDGCGDGDLIEADVLGVVRGASVESGEEAEVVEAGDSAVEQADDCEPDVAGMERGGEDIELAEEAAGEGDSNE